MLEPVRRSGFKVAHYPDFALFETPPPHSIRSGAEALNCEVARSRERRAMGKFCNVVSRPVNKGLGMLQMSGAKLNAQGTRHCTGAAFGGVAELCRNT